MKKLKRLLPALCSAVVLCGCAVGTQVLNLTAPHDGYAVYRDIAYGTDKQQHLDAYIPAVHAVGNPVMVFFHGGNWQQGSKSDDKFVAQTLASKGITVVMADYRLFPAVTFPDFMTDAAQAVAWAHAHMDSHTPGSLFVAGYDSGAYIAVMLTLNPQYLQSAGGNPGWLKGAIGIAGPYDFLPFKDPKVKAIFSKVPEADTQPVNFAHANTPPLLLITGAEDSEVAPDNSIYLATKLRKYGNTVVEDVYPGVGHMGIKLAFSDFFRSKAPVLEDISNFIAHGSSDVQPATQLQPAPVKKPETIKRR
ncbi:MAG TPA: alpha/beta hydrolase [Rickettsiales bacterium]|nr:alpha/beta hydrolase [Rickettsiales bacterium]